MKTLSVVHAPCCTPGAPRLEPNAAETLAALFKALADPARVAIVNRLAGQNEVCVCDLNRTLDLTQPTVSHHLKVLREAGIVEVAARRGTWTYYRLVPGTLEQLAFALGGQSPRPVAAGNRGRRAAAS